MRRPRDLDAELKALADKAKILRERRIRQLGELVAATGADALDAELLAGALLHAVGVKETKTMEAWRIAGAAFFRTSSRSAARGPHSRARSASPDDSAAASR